MKSSTMCTDFLTHATWFAELFYSHDNRWLYDAVDGGCAHAVLPETAECNHELHQYLYTKLGRAILSFEFIHSQFHRMFLIYAYLMS